MGRILSTVFLGCLLQNFSKTILMTCWLSGERSSPFGLLVLLFLYYGEILVPIALVAKLTLLLKQIHSVGVEGMF